MTAYKIVCVDDEPLALRYLTSLLKEINPQNIIKTFSSSLEALEYLKNNRPDIVFLDIDMPHLNGIELREYSTRSLCYALKKIYRKNNSPPGRKGRWTSNSKSKHCI